jgi:hypothetical protein
MLHLTTYFDKNYLSRGLVLYESLKKYTQDFELYILCLDEFTLDFFENKKADFPEVKTLKLEDIESNDQDLLQAKSNRSKIEYYFTLSPVLPLYLLKKHNLPHICSLDADILFLNSPKPIFDYLQNFSVVITPHKFSKELLFLEKYGKYNVSFQIFKNNVVGIQCLEFWKKQCVEWCADEYDEANDRFADQKYLDNWITLYPNEVHVLNDAVSGLAPWNLNNYVIEKKDTMYSSNSEQIIFYHFHHFKIFSEKWASNGFNEYKVRNQEGIDELYVDYWQKIEKFNEELSISSDNSSRYKTSSKLLPKLLKEKTVYKKEGNSLKHVSFAHIPKFIRKLIIKVYA